ncbi:MAG: hypothetical protein WDZ70_00520 [Candidatus Paceibacterota bacterium]
MMSLESVPLPHSPEEGDNKEEKTPRLPGGDLTPEERAELQEVLAGVFSGMYRSESRGREEKKPLTTLREEFAEEDFRDAGRTPIEEDEGEAGLDRAA